MESWRRSHQRDGRARRRGLGLRGVWRGAGVLPRSLRLELGLQSLNALWDRFELRKFGEDNCAEQRCARLGIVRARPLFQYFHAPFFSIFGYFRVCNGVLACTNVDRTCEAVGPDQERKTLTGLDRGGILDAIVDRRVVEGQEAAHDPQSKGEERVK